MEIEPSKFINEDISVSKAELLDATSATSRLYKLRIGGRLYFMKQLRAEYAADPRYRSMFFKEYENGKAIKHPYVVEYTSINENEDGLYILMEYVNGITLADKLRTEPEYFATEKNIYLLVEQLLEALRAMHACNIIYLDLSPNNIILTKTENSLKLVDLGFSINDSNDFTAGFTKNFVAPEAVEGSVRDVDNRSDIYAVGCLLRYIEEKTGVPLPSRLQRVKARCLLPVKSKRYASVDEILSIVKNRKRAKWGRVAAWVAAVAVLLLGFVCSPLCSALVNYIGWETGRYPARFEEGGIFYAVTSHSERTVAVSFKGSTPGEYEYEYKGGEIVIPRTVTNNGREFAVTSIDCKAFFNPYVSQVPIPAGITTIADSAFYGCLLNDTVRIPASVTSIGAVAIYPMCYIKGYVVDAANPVYDSRGGCNALIETATNTLVAGCESTVIPGNVTSIADNAFMGVEGLTYINIPPSVTEIGKNAFVHTGLKEIVLPAGLAELKQYTFQYCSNLRSVALPASLTTIGMAALSHCAFEELVIPDSVVASGAYAFDCNRHLEKVVIGAGCRAIGDCAFDGCHKLATVVSRIPAHALFEVNNNVFGNISKDCVLYVPKGAAAAYKNTHGWAGFSRIVEM